MNEQGILAEILHRLHAQHRDILSAKDKTEDHEELVYLSGANLAVCGVINMIADYLPEEATEIPGKKS